MPSPFRILILSLSTLTSASQNCSRSLLTSTTNAYLTSQTLGSPPPGNYTYTENLTPTALSKSILTRPLALTHTRSIHDTISCSTYTELIITNASAPYVIGTQIRVEPATGEVLEISSLVTKPGDWLFNVTGTEYWSAREDWGVIPTAQRDSRETIKAAADAYLDIFNNASVVVPWGTPCARLEGGMYTGKGAANDSCNVGVPSGVQLVDRWYVVDETVGAVDVMLRFGGENGAPDSHQFRVQGGRLRFVHTITVYKGTGGLGR